MHSFSEYLQHTSPEAQIDAFFESFFPVLEQKLEQNSLESDAKSINDFEGSDPNFFEVHLGLVLSGGASAVSKYYRELTKDRRALVEKLKTRPAQEKAKTVNEISNKIKKHQAQLITEESAEDYNKRFGDLSDDSVIDMATQGIDSPESKSSIFSLLKDLYLAVTENNSLQGWGHLILDIIGLWPGGVGLAADCINAIFYFYRRKPLLGIISLISAFIPIAGDALKVIKFGKNAKSADAAIKFLMETQNVSGVQITEYFARTGAPVNLLKYFGVKISRFLSKAFTIISGAIGWLKNKVGRYPKLKNMLDNLLTFVEKTKKGLNNFIDNLKYAKKIDKVSPADVKADLGKILFPPGQLGKTGGKLVIDKASDTVKFYSVEGKLLREFPKELLSKKNIIWANSPNMRSFFRVGMQPEDLVNYFNTITRVAPQTNKTAASVLNKIFGKSVDATVWAATRAAFLGKQLIKYITGKTPEELEMSEELTEYFGADLLNQEVQRKRKEAMDKGAKYVPFVEFDALNPEDVQTITKYQNSWSKMMGLPEVVPVLYNQAGYPELARQYNEFWEGKSDQKKKMPEYVSKFGNEEIVRRDQEFWKKVAKGEIKRDEQGNLIKVAPESIDKIVQKVPDLKQANWYLQVSKPRTN